MRISINVGFKQIKWCLCHGFFALSFDDFDEMNEIYLCGFNQGAILQLMT